MKTRLYTVHHKGPDEIRAIADKFSFLAFLLPPVWAVWHGLWVTLLAQAALHALAVLWTPLAVLPAWIGIALVLGFEGASVRRAELGLRGWREAGVVEARTPEGAEERFLRGEAT